MVTDRRGVVSSESHARLHKLIVSELREMRHPLNQITEEAIAEIHLEYRKGQRGGDLPHVEFRFVVEMYLTDYYTGGGM